MLSKNFSVELHSAAEQHQSACHSVFRIFFVKTYTACPVATDFRIDPLCSIIFLGLYTLDIMTIFWLPDWMWHFSITQRIYVLFSSYENIFESSQVGWFVNFSRAITCTVRVSMTWVNIHTLDSWSDTPHLSQTPPAILRPNLQRLVDASVSQDIYTVVQTST